MIYLQADGPLPLVGHDKGRSGAQRQHTKIEVRLLKITALVGIRLTLPQEKATVLACLKAVSRVVGMHDAWTDHQGKVFGWLGLG